MSDEITVKLEDVKALFEFLERLNAIYHSEEKLRDEDLTEKFWLHGGYTDLHRLYYEVVWNWLPAAEQKQIEDKA